MNTKMKTKKMLKLSMAFAALSAVAMARADLTLEVAGTQSFSDAVVAAGSSVAALNGGASKSERIVKTGSGTLTMSVHDLNLASWEGDLVIRAGTVRVTVSADFATTPVVLGSITVGNVIVEDGATLEMYSEKIASAYSYSYGTGPLRPVHISGTGVNGKGALRLEIESGAAGGSVRAVVPKNLVLDDDATIGWINKFGVIRDSNAVDLGGNTLTFSGEYASGSGSIAWYDANKGFVNTGNLVFDGVTLYSRSTSPDVWEGDDSHSVTLKNGASLAWDWNGVYVGFNWQLTGSPKSFINGSLGSYDIYSDRSNWYGPMRLGSTVELYYQNGNDTDRSNKILCTSLLGKISGVGGFLSDATQSKYNSGGWKTTGLNLGGDGNDFTGPLALKGMTLGLYSTNAIPHANDNVVLTNCVVKTVLLGGTDPAGKTDPVVTSLETLRIVDGGTIDGNVVLSRVAAEKIVKSGAGTLDVNLPMDVNRIELLGGTLKLFQVDAGEIDLSLFRRSTAGLQYGYLPKGDSDQNSGYVGIDSEPYNVYVTNSVIRIPLECDAPVSSWYDYFHVTNHAYRTYSGYVWNDEHEARDWTFLVTYNGKWDLTVAGETKKNDPRTPPLGADHPVPTLCTFTLQPGANEFRFRSGNHFVSAHNYGNVATNGLENWTSDRYAWGLVYDPQGRGSLDADCYTQFSTNEVIPLFTTTVPGGNSYASRIGTLAGTSDATFDLNGQTVSANTVEGCVNVSNGTVTDISTWKLLAAEIIDPGTYANGFSFASDAVVDVVDASDLPVLHSARNSGPFVLAVDFLGAMPVVSQRLHEEGWRVFAEDGDLKIKYEPHGLTIIVR
jgi:autotransporter-associated beta strand protein